jgi:hypothetical protein
MDLNHIIQHLITILNTIQALKNRRGMVHIHLAWVPGHKGGNRHMKEVDEVDEVINLPSCPQALLPSKPIEKLS